MAGKVFFSVTMSLDGFIAPEERMDDPDVQRWTAQWMELQQWIFPQRFFRESLKLGGVQAHRISTDPVAGRQHTPPLRAGPCRRGIQERQAHRTTRRIRRW